MSCQNINKFSVNDLVQLLSQSKSILPRSFKIEMDNFSFTANYHISESVYEILSPTLISSNSVFYLPSNPNVAIISLNRRFLDKNLSKLQITVESSDVLSMKSFLKILELGSTNKIVSGNYKVVNMCRWFVDTYMIKPEEPATV